MTLRLAEDTQPRLTGSIRLDVFATVVVAPKRGRKAKEQGVAWQGWNRDPAMEDAHARLTGSGSFYWHGAIQALTAAKRMMRQDARIHQIKLESISGQEVGRVYR